MRKVMAMVALLAAGPGAAAPTELVVRVLSQGAKFVGTGVGGAQVTVRDAGRVVAQGRVEGGTGDTGLIMEPQPRGKPMADAKTATFRAMLDIAEPRLLTVEVRGPGQPAGGAVTATVQRWLLPGAPVTGDGWVVELPGLAVAPRRDGARLVAHVQMLCGCPIEAGGRWDAARFTVVAHAGGRTVPLAFAGTTGDFAGDVPAGAVTVTALDTLTGATGVARLKH